MAFGGMIQTSGGRQMLEWAMNGEPMMFTKIVLGNGSYSGSFTELKAVVDPVLTIDKMKVTRISSGLLLEGQLESGELNVGVYYREIGIFASCGGEEALYAYDNAGNDPVYVPPAGGAVDVSERIRIILTVSESASVVIDSSGALWVTHQDLEGKLESYALVENVDGHIGDTGIHVTPEQMDNIEVTIGNFVGHANDLSRHVTTEQMENIGIAIGNFVGHADDEMIHVTAEKQSAWTQGAVTASGAAAEIKLLKNIDRGLEARIARLEDAIFSNITGNPWAVSFGELTGVTLSKGCWNVAQQRIEC